MDPAGVWSMVRSAGTASGKSGWLTPRPLWASSCQGKQPDTRTGVKKEGYAWRHYLRRQGPVLEQVKSWRSADSVQTQCRLSAGGVRAECRWRPKGGQGLPCIKRAGAAG
jgi:hypothetical protein